MLFNIVPSAAFVHVAHSKNPVASMLTGFNFNFVLYVVWLGKWFLFQTFEELDGIKDKELEVRRIRQLLDEGQKEEPAC